MDENSVKFSDRFLDEFDSIETIGVGGMARVFRARQRRLDRSVAIKVILSDYFSLPEARARFMREGRVTASLKHPNIVSLLAVGEDLERPYLVFELIEGVSLRDVLARGGPMKLDRALEIGRQISAGLAEAHTHGVVHRDLKPDNVLVDRMDRIKIADFGLALDDVDGSRRLTQDGVILGTPGYLAPEIIRGGTATTASDVYAVGIILYELLSGDLPITAATDRELLVRYLREEIPPLAKKGVVVPEVVQRLVDETVVRDPTSRIRDGKSLHKRMIELQAGVRPSRPHTTRYVMASSPGVPAPDSPSSAAGRPSHSVTRHISMAIALAAGHRRVAIVLVPLILLLGLLSALAARWLVSPRGSIFELMGAPTIVMGETSAYVSWRTNLPCPTRLLVWSTVELEGKMLWDPAHDPHDPLRTRPPVTVHHYTIRRIDPRQRWRFKVVFGDGSRSTSAYDLVPLGDGPRGLVAGVRKRHLAGGALEVLWTTRHPLRSGVLLEVGGKTEAETRHWADGEVSDRHRAVLRDVDPSAQHRAWVVFLQLTDQVPIEPILGLHAMAGRLLAVLPSLTPTRLQGLADLVLRSANGPPGSRPRNPRVQTGAGALEGALDGWVRDNLGVEWDQIASGVPLLLADERLDGQAKSALYQLVARLEVADQAGFSTRSIEREVLGTRAVYCPLVAIDYPSQEPGGKRLLSTRSDPEFRSSYTRNFLPITVGSLPPATSELGPLGTLHEVVTDVTDSERFLDPKDRSYVARFELTREEARLARRVGVLATTLDFDLGVEATINGAFTAHLRNRIGAFRGIVSSARGLSDEGRRRLREDVARKANWITATLPAGLFQPGVNEVRLGVKALCALRPGGRPVLSQCWLVEAVVGPATP